MVQVLHMIFDSLVHICKNNRCLCNWMPMGLVHVVVLFLWCSSFTNINYWVYFWEMLIRCSVSLVKDHSRRCFNSSLGKWLHVLVKVMNIYVSPSYSDRWFKVLSVQRTHESIYCLQQAEWTRSEWCSLSITIWKAYKQKLQINRLRGLKRTAITNHSNC